jgi:serine phosphatase RsbU (regulator of sigma subunit)
VALVASLIGLLELFMGFDLRWIPGPISLPFVVPTWRDGTVLMLVGFVLLNLLVILEVADRLSLKNDLEIARDIQKQMLPRDAFRAEGLETFGLTRPANTVGGDFYEISQLPDGRVIVAVGDVAGKGSPAALLMALLLAIMRTLLDEGLEPAALVDRLNLQIARHSPASRFITLFFAVIDPASGAVEYVNAGHLPPIVRRRDGTFARLAQGGIALGLSKKSKYAATFDHLDTGDLIVLYSDGITEAESEAGVSFDEAGIEHVLSMRPDATAPDLSRDVFAAVERHVGDQRLADDLTVVVARRLPPLPRLSQ